MKTNNYLDKIIDKVKRNKEIVILFLIAAIIRSLLLNVITYGDNLVWFWAAQDLSNFGFNFFVPIYGGTFIWSHPPIAPLIYRLFAFIFGYSNLALKLVPFVFGMVNLGLVYKLAKRFFDKRVAFYSVLIMTFSIWHLISSSLVEHDSSIMMFMYLLTFYTFLKYEQSKEKKWLFYSGLVFGLALLVKYNAAIIFAILGAYFLIKTRDVKKTFFTLFPIFLVGLIILSTFMALCFTLAPEYLYMTLGHASNKLTAPSLRIFVYIFIWATPMLSLLSLFSIFGLKKNKRLLLLLSWFFVPFLVYMFAVPIIAYERHLAVTIPAMSVLAGWFVSKLRFDKKQIYAGSLALIAIFALMWLLNMKEVQYIPHNIGNYISYARNLNWNFFFPLTGAGGPIFGLSFDSIAYPLIICGALFTVSFLSYMLKKTNLFKYSIILFIGASLGFNLYMDYEFINPSAHPDISRVTYEAMEYYMENYEGKFIYTNTFALSLYLNKTIDELYLFGYGHILTDEQYEDFMDSIKSNSNYVVIIIDFPIMSKDDEVWAQINECQLNKTFYSNSKIAGYIFECP